MPDILDANGLQTSSFTEVRDQLVTDLRAVYGSDISVDQNSPDGQMINIYAQAGVDYRELLTSIYNSMNPDNAVGTLLDQRCAINNIQRYGATYTIQPIDIFCDRTLTLSGLDGEYNNPNGTGFTVSDNSGNQFILIDTITITAGSHTLNFRAKDLGEVETIVGTIQTMVTIVLGVTSVDNSSGALEIGQNQETDAQLRIRRQRSVSIGSEGYLNSIEGRILDLEGVTQCKVYENYTNATDADLIPAHSIWVIVENGANEDIANIIYETKSAGCGMKGDVEVDITTPSGQIFIAKFDRPIAEDLYIQFDIKKLQASATFDEDAIKQYIVDNLDYNIGDVAYTTNITAIAQAGVDATGGNGVVINVEISNDGISWEDYLETSTKQHQWTLSVNDITITVI